MWHYSGVRDELAREDDKREIGDAYKVGDSIRTSSSNRDMNQHTTEGVNNVGKVEDCAWHIPTKIVYQTCEGYR